jgi:hypothetical protein
MVHFSVAALLGGVLVSCQSAQTRAQPVRHSKVMYSAARLQPHVDPPETAPIERRGKDTKPEGVVSRGLRGVAKGLSLVGRVPALPATLMFGAMAGNGEALSSAGRFFSESLP